MEHEGALFASFHCVLRRIVNIVEVLEVPRVHTGEVSLAKLVEMVDGPALNQPVKDPKCGIWNSTARTATLLDDVLPTVPRTEEMSAILHDSRYCTQTTLVLVSNYGHVGPVHRWVRFMNEFPELLPTFAVLITKDYCKAHRRHVSISGNTITRKQSVLAEIQVARISHV
jgi:hypothetical protein